MTRAATVVNLSAYNEINPNLSQAKTKQAYAQAARPTLNFNLRTHKMIEFIKSLSPYWAAFGWPVILIGSQILLYRSFGKNPNEDKPWGDRTFFNRRKP